MITSNYPISISKIRLDISKRIERRNNGKKALFATNDLSVIKKINNEFGETVIRVEGEIPIVLPVNNGDHFLFISHDQSLYTHGLHKFPAKFFPELPRWLIKKYSKEGDFILDPFSGSATTNLEALLNKRHSVGIDIDPFSRYLSKVKTTPLDQSQLNQSFEELIIKIEGYHPKMVDKTSVPSFPYIENWFNKEIVYELTYLRDIIKELEVSQEIKNFFLICFSSIIRAVSNADNNCTRTVIRKSLNKKVYPSMALKKFVEKTLSNIPKMNEFSKMCPKYTRVLFPQNMDARDIKFPDEIFELAITSPPYVNAVDYPRTHQLESYWLELVNGSLAPYKRKHVGTESVFLNDYKYLHRINIEEADKIIGKIFENDPRRAYIAYKFLEDMKKNLEEVYRVLKEDSRYIIVIGNNKIRGHLFESWKYLMKISGEVGFTLEKYFASEIINHFIKVPRNERINTDWILVLKK